jgi:hypothetical protein
VTAVRLLEPRESKLACIGLRTEQSDQVSDPPKDLLESLIRIGIPAQPFSNCSFENVGVLKITIDRFEMVGPNDAIVEGTVGLLWAGRRFRLQLNGDDGRWRVMSDSFAP